MIHSIRVSWISHSQIPIDLVEIILQVFNMNPIAIRGKVFNLIIGIGKPVTILICNRIVDENYILLL